MFKKNQDPIVVVVANNRYECFGPLNRRSARLTAILQRLGGVNETVPNGQYHFNVARRRFTLIASLYPID